MERDAFHVSYLSDKTREAVFPGQAVRTVAYLRVSTAQQHVCSQRLATLEYAHKHNFLIGPQGAERPQEPLFCAG